MNKHELILAIGIAIGIRDTANKVSLSVLSQKIEELSKFSIFSNRQIESLVQGVMSRGSINKLTHKSSKTGGRLNPNHLENIRDLMLGFDAGRIDWDMVERTVREGTSQNMLARLTGISKSQINRRLNESVQQKG